MKKINISKINSIYFGGKWICLGLILGGVIPGIIYGIILLAFIVIFTIEMIQDSGKIPYYERTLKESIPLYNLETVRKEY